MIKNNDALSKDIISQAIRRIAERCNDADDLRAMLDMLGLDPSMDAFLVEYTTSFSPAKDIVGTTRGPRRRSVGL